MLRLDAHRWRQNETKRNIPMYSYEVIPEHGTSTDFRNSHKNTWERFVWSHFVYLCASTLREFERHNFHRVNDWIWIILITVTKYLITFEYISIADNFLSQLYGMVSSCHLVEVGYNKFSVKILADYITYQILCQYFS